MTRVWHIGPRRYSGAAFTGKGGLIADGRWHHAGRPIVYTASSEALAALEILAHVRSVDNIGELVVRHADFDDLVVAEVRVADLPKGWGRPEPLSATQEIGDEWLHTKRTAVLWVPSVHVQSGRNALLNPLHMDFKKIDVSKVTSFRFDQRIRRMVYNASEKG